MITRSLISTHIRPATRIVGRIFPHNFQLHTSSLREGNINAGNIPMNSNLDIERRVLDALSSLEEPVTSLPLGNVGLIQSIVVQPSSSSAPSKSFAVKVHIDVLVPGYTGLDTLRSSCMNALRSMEFIDTENCEIQLMQRSGNNTCLLFIDTLFDIVLNYSPQLLMFYS